MKKTRSFVFAEDLPIKKLGEVKCRICEKVFDREKTKRKSKVCTPCYNSKQMERYERNRDSISKYFSRFLNRVSNSNKYPCDITVEDLILLYEKQEGRCALSGIEMRVGSKRNSDGSNNPHGISVDRIDNSMPYTIENVWLICMSLNQFKNSYSLDTFFDIIRKTVSYNSLMDVVESF